MSKVFQGTTTNNVTELTLQEEGAGNIGTQTIVWDDTQGTIDQVLGDIPDNWKQNDTSLKQLQIGSSCTSIGDNAIRNCQNITGELKIPNTVTSIGNNAFDFCFGLTGTLSISKNITSIGSYAFYFCNNIGRIDIFAATAPTITSGAFYGMNATIHVPSGATGYAASYDGLTVVADL